MTEAMTVLTALAASESKSEQISVLQQSWLSNSEISRADAECLLGKLSRATTVCFPPQTSGMRHGPSAAELRGPSTLADGGAAADLGTG